jgi:hypothetical protein
VIRCRVCGLRQFHLNAEPGHYGISGQPIGTVIEGPPEAPDGRRVESRPASGGRSYSTTAKDGSFTAEVSGALDRGRTGESHALKILTQALRERGDEVIEVPGACDDRGEDGLLVINGRRVVVQVVSLPVERGFWRELSFHGTAIRRGTSEEAVQLVRQALIRKAGKAVGTLLVLDATHFGAFISPSLVKAYQQAYGDPETEFALFEAWIVGPTARSAFRFGLG